MHVAMQRKITIGMLIINNVLLILLFAGLPDSMAAEHRCATPNVRQKDKQPSYSGFTSLTSQLLTSGWDTVLITRP